MQELLTKVQLAFKSAFDIDPQTVTMDTTPLDIPVWDSIGHVVLAGNLEKAFGLSFDAYEILEMENVKEICRVIEGKLDGGPACDS